MSLFSGEPEHAVVEGPRPRRGRFWLLLLGVPLLLVGLAVIGWIVVAGHGLRRAIAEADAQDPGWRLEDLEQARVTPPPGHNAAERVLAAARLLPQSGQNQKQLERLWDLHPPALLNDPQAAGLRAFLAAAGPPALAEARALIETSCGRHVISWSPDPFSTLLKCQANREAACLLYYDALERAQAGDLGGA